VLERFFDESGGMQLVLHAPFGSRINKAWTLALRKRFCRQFNFELQAAATEDALLLSLGPQHSFPLSDVFRYLHPATTRDILVQAMLDAPLFKTRWRWNTTISLAVPRSRGGSRVPPQLQRMLADDLMAAIFPDAAACLENIPGDREIPDHPLVNQTVRDCLEEAMDFDGLTRVLTRIHSGELHLVARDTPEPSAFAHEILNAKPYAFLDDAPLEERRTHAVQTRMAPDQAGSEMGVLDANAIARVRDEVRPDPRDADELHDALLTAGFLSSLEIPIPATQLTDTSRATWAVPRPSNPESRVPNPVTILIAAERLPELQTVHPGVMLNPPISAPPARAARSWTREVAIVELLRGRLSIVGPTTASDLGASLAITETDATAALLTLESEGAVLRGHFSPRPPELSESRIPNSESRTVEWCDRRLLARIHRYTLNRLRAEIAPVSAADFMRFLFAWQHVEPSSRLIGIDGLREVIARLDGIEAPARAWERDVLAGRVDQYDASMLDLLCLTGSVAWARLSSGPTQVVGATPIALFLREHTSAWLALSPVAQTCMVCAPELHDAQAMKACATGVLLHLQTHGASFATEIASACDLTDEELRGAIAELVASGAISSDGFEGLRAIVGTMPHRATARLNRSSASGRWFLVRKPTERNERPEQSEREIAIETFAWTLLRRYGVIFRRLLAREALDVPWRELARVYRRLEARGEVRGGRFVAGMSGEQFALPDAVERLREIRRSTHDDRLITISAADPLNLTGIIAGEERIRASAANRIVYRNGIPVAAMEGDLLRTFGDLKPELAADAAAAAAGRRVPVISGFVGRL
jgi:ATP-dependent Lhr-like helicase